MKILQGRSYIFHSKQVDAVRKYYVKEITKTSILLKNLDGSGRFTRELLDRFKSQWEPIEDFGIYQESCKDKSNKGIGALEDYYKTLMEALDYWQVEEQIGD